MKPLVFKDEGDITDSKASLKIAEKLVGKSMPNPSGATEQEKIYRHSSKSHYYIYDLRRN